jgi:hypothetical protein
MGSRTKYEYDLFISYTHLDDERYDADRGWIDLLHERLAVRLGQLLGDAPVIWRDGKLQGNDYFADALIEKLSQVALLVSILSPRYVRSEWCRRELRAFADCVREKQSSHFNEKSRIFKVLKTPVEFNDQPGELQGLLGYQFYETDAVTGRPSEFSHHKEGANYDKRYWERLNDLAWDIKNLLEIINPRAGAADLTPASGKTIYLATTTADLMADWDRVRRELLQHGHRIVPDKPLPFTPQLRADVGEYLSESHLSVHLVGANYALVPEGEAKSIVELQHEMAAERSRSDDFTQIVWMPSGLNSADLRQQRFIDELASHSSFNENRELLQTKLEDLKDFIHQKLIARPPAPEMKPEMNSDGQVIGDQDPTLVYIACDQPDYEAVAPIEECLYDRGFEVISLAGEADPQAHKEHLLLCDAVLTYCGRTTDGWLNLKKMDLIKLPGYGRTRPMLAKGFYLSIPQTSGKERFRVHDGLVIRNYGDFSPTSLDPFVEQIERAKGARS